MEEVDGTQLCSIVRQSPRAATLTVGQHVAEMVAQLDEPDRSGWREVFVLADLAP